MLTAIVALTVGVQELKLPPMDTVTLLLFKSGKSSKGMDPVKIEQMQKGHIANLERLGKAKKAPAAGPFENGGEYRGIVILTLPMKDVPKEFANDPYVKEGLLNIELHSWMMPKGLFAWPKPDKFEMQKYVFGWVSKGPNYDEKGSPDFVKHVNHTLGLMRDGRAACAGPLTDKNNWALGAYVFNSDDANKVEEWQKADPHIVSGRLELHTLDLWMAKGLFQKLKP